MSVATNTGRDSEGSIHWPNAIFVFAHGLLALGAAAQRWWIGELGPATDRNGIAAAGFATLAGYAYLRLVRTTERDIIPSDHIRWYRDHRGSMILFVVLCVAVAVVCSFGQTLVFGPWSAIVLLPLLLYLLPIRGSKGRAIGLRELPGLKAILVAAGWTFVTIGFTSDTSEYALDLSSWMAAMQFCFFLALAIAFDIADLKYDRPELRTIPQIVGIRGAKLIALILLLPWIWFLVITLVWTYSPIEAGWREPGLDPEFLLPLFGFLATAFVIAKVEPDRPKWYFSVLMDGMVLLIPVLGWVGMRL